MGSVLVCGKVVSWRGWRTTVALCCLTLAVSLSVIGCGGGKGDGEAWIYYTDPLGNQNTKATKFIFKPVATAVCTGTELVPGVKYKAEWKDAAGTWHAGTVNDLCAAATPSPVIEIDFSAAPVDPGVGCGTASQGTCIKVKAGPAKLSDGTAMLPGTLTYDAHAGPCANVAAPATWTMTIKC